MAVKNGGDLIKESIYSIQCQTYTNFELIIINDGSTDETESVLLECSKFDNRINFYSQENQGLSKSLNRALSLARGELIARQDHDDLSMPTRFEKQVEFLKKNTDCGLLGTSAEIWDLNGATGRFHDHPTNFRALKFSLIFNNPFVHSSLMFHREILETVGLYSTDPKREPPEDYEFISRIARKYNTSNLAERLVVYRETPGSISSEIRPDHIIKTSFTRFQDNLAKISAENLAYANKLSEVDIHCRMFGHILHSSSPPIIKNADFRRICQLLNTARIQGGAINKSEEKFYRRQVRHFYAKYFSFKKLDLSQILLFIFSGFDEFNFILGKIMRRILKFIMA